MHQTYPKDTKTITKRHLHTDIVMLCQLKKINQYIRKTTKEGLSHYPKEDLARENMYE
jgi:hypothetical protein